MILKIIKIVLLVCVTIAGTLFAQSHWYRQTSNTLRTLRSVFFLDANTGYACGDSCIVLSTFNGGSSWSKQGVPGYGVNYAITFADHDTGYVGGNDEDGLGTIYKTTNSGSSWQQQNPNTYNPIYGMFILPGTGGNTVYAVGANGLMTRTTNGGANWYLQTPGNYASLFSIFFKNNNTGFACGWNALITTTDASLDWGSVMYFYGPPVALTSIVFVDSTIGYVSSYSDYNSIGVLKTTNAGLNWFVSGGASGYCLSFPSQNLGYMVFKDGSIFKTTDGGGWYSQNSGFSDTLWSVSFVNESTGWVVGDSGVILKTTDGGGPIGIRQINHQVPEHYSLYQNYPNPFNPSTKIKFSLPNPSKGGAVDTKLIVYDILGREIATLVNQALSSGTYEADWNAAGFGSGVYIYRIVAGNYVSSKKMVLIK